MMPQYISGEQKIEEIIDVARGAAKCRIPQRLPAGRQKAINPKARNQNNFKSARPKMEIVALQQSRFAMRNNAKQHLRLTENRPRSANQTKDDMPQAKPPHMASPRLLDRPERDSPLDHNKRPSPIPKKVLNDTLPLTKCIRPVIAVPVTQKQLSRNTYNSKSSGLPTQEVIKKCEELELLKGEFSDAAHVLTDFNEGESITSQSDKISEVKINWQVKLKQFDEMKNDLTERQKALIEVYASLRLTHQRMTMLGQKVPLPSAEDLSIMNVAKLSPEQWLQLCSDVDHNPGLLKIDTNKLYNMPSKLIDSCEHTLNKRKEIIDWFENLKTQEKGITMSTLSKKLNEFNAENEMMKSSLQMIKADFFNEFNEIIDIVKKCMSETIALRVQSEELKCALSNLNSQNVDLRKQLSNSDHLKCQTTKGRLEQLEKELKDERCKKIVMKDRLTKAEGQVRIGTERASQLEAALEQARSQTWTLERTVQQLHEQNKKLQDDFEREFTKLTESIKENTVNLEEIADAREKLKFEKEDLEKRLGKLSEYYNESLKNMKHEINVNVVKLLETEKKYDEQIEEMKILDSKVESLCAQLLESQLRVKDLTKELEEKDLLIRNSKDIEKQLETTKADLDSAKITIEEYEKRLFKQTEAIEEIERNLKHTMNLEESLKNNLSEKAEYILVLEKKQCLLEQQLHDSECKMQSYETQLSSLKNHIKQLQDDFGEFENLNDLNQMIHHQRAKLSETTTQNTELAETLQKKDLELEQHLENLAEQESLLKQRDAIINMLTEKEEEQSNIIKLLRKNLEIRAQADAGLNHHINHKIVGMDTSLTNIDTKKQTISQLEKIILTLEDQIRTTSQQLRKDQEKIVCLEEKLLEYENINMEYKRSIESPSNNLDNFIKILEDELGTCIDTQYGNIEPEYVIPRQRYVGDYKRGKPQRFQLEVEISNEHPYKDKEHGKVSNKLQKRKGVGNMEDYKSTTLPEPPNMYTIPLVQDTLTIINEQTPVEYPKNKYYPMRSLPFLIPRQFREEKKFKMFKVAGHKL